MLCLQKNIIFLWLRKRDRQPKNGTIPHKTERMVTLFIPINLDYYFRIIFTVFMISKFKLVINTLQTKNNNLTFYIGVMQLRP